MVKRKLVEKLITDGAMLLCELDRQNFDVQSMFWIHLTEADYWRLIIASPIVTQQGSLTGYGRLDEIIDGLDLAGLALDDISLVDPESPQFRSFFSTASTSSRLAAGSAWLEFEEAIVYRWSDSALRGEVNCNCSSSELKQLWEDERKITHDPELLVSMDKRQVTLRIHPKHGPLQGIENIRQAFAIALHRARPECQIRWRD